MLIMTINEPNNAVKNGEKLHDADPDITKELQI